METDKLTEPATPMQDGRLPKLITRKETTVRDLVAVLTLVVLGSFLVSQQNHLNDARRTIDKHGVFIDSLRIEAAKMASAPSDLAAQQGRLNALQERIRTVEARLGEGDE